MSYLAQLGGMMLALFMLGCLVGALAWRYFGSAAADLNPAPSLPGEETTRDETERSQ